MYRIALGFSLIEVLLALNILAITMVMVSPNFQAYYHYIKIRMIAYQIMQELYLARSDAISLQQKISYCSQKGDWSLGRIILSESGAKIHHFTSLPKPYHLILRNSLGCNDKIHYLPLGFTREQRGSFYLSSPEETLRIVIGLSGKVNIHWKY